MKYLLLILLLAGCSCSLLQKEEPKDPATSPHLAGWTYTCENGPLEDLKICVHKKGTPKKTIWFNHGAGCSERVLIDPSSCISLPGSEKSGVSEKELMTKLNDVAVVTISFGPIFLLDPEQATKEKGTADRDATVTNYVAQMKAIAAKHSLPMPYQLIGHSMGGFNALMLAYKVKGFTATILINPFIPDCDVFSKEIINEDCPADMLINFSPLITDPQFTQKRWKQIDPLVLMKTVNPLSAPILVTSCEEDVFGLSTGPRKWAAETMKQWNVIGSHTIGGGENCHFEYGSVDLIINFLDVGGQL